MPAGLNAIDLTDVSVIVRLMSLCACGQVSQVAQYVAPPSESDPGTSQSEISTDMTSTSGLQYLSSSIGALIQDNHSARNKLLKLCTKVSVQQRSKIIIFNYIWTSVNRTPI